MTGARARGAGLLALGLLAPAACEPEQEQLRRALGDVEPVGEWIYDDIELGIRKAEETGKPLLFTFRCVL